MVWLIWAGLGWFNGPLVVRNRSWRKLHKDEIKMVENPFI